MKLLVVVDMQKDFIDGALGTKEAQAIVEHVAAKIRTYREAGDRIVFTMDTHAPDYLNTQEGRNLPVPHCIKGTPGWELDARIRDAAGMDRNISTSPSGHGKDTGLSSQKGNVNVENCPGKIYKIYEKVTFGSEEYALDWKNGFFADVDEVELVGLCTDICVISNALLTKAFAPEVKVSVDPACCAGVTPQSHANALEAMKMCQVFVH